MEVFFNNINRLVVLLIRATNYDERGYPRRFRFGVLPSNSLAVMNSLTMQALDQIINDKSLPIRYSKVEVFDDFIWSQRVTDPRKLIRKYQDGHTKIVVGLVGVQSNQFPRARDLAVEFQKAGAQVVIGGFHVSGSIAAIHDGIGEADPSREEVPCPHKMPKEIQELTDIGVTVCCGESENSWRTILTDIIRGQNKPFYHGDLPDLALAPLPKYPPGYFKRFATVMTTFDFSRGCPFSCKFCTVINVQGRTLRSRDPKMVLDMLRQICEQEGGVKVFITDDNMARNPRREEILDGLTLLRNEGYRVDFMCQVDAMTHRIEDFIEKLRDAGCSQVFWGMESLNPLNLEEVGKRQNDVEEYKLLCDTLHKNGIVAHASYIIGFAHDTKESIMNDVKTLQAVGADQASFFILTPLPGSENHVRALTEGVVMDEDLNRYDSMHAVVDHPNMTRPELERSLYDCYREFYRTGHMINVLRRVTKNNFWGMILCFLWYRNSMLNEHVHPTMCGYWSIRRRSEMKPGHKKEGWIKFLAKEFWFKLRYFGLVLKEFYIFQYAYFEATRKNWVESEAVSQKLSGCKRWFKNTFTTEPSRKWLNDFWIRYGRQKWSLFWKPQWHWKMLPHALTEIIYSWKFWRVLKTGIDKMRK